MTLGLVCGFRAEERIASATGGLTAIGWHNPEAASGLIAHGATTLLSFGIAGALDPSLRSGDLLLPTEIRLDDGHAMTISPDLHEILAASFPGARHDPIAYTSRIVATKREKENRFVLGGAIAIDMESGMLARAALDAGIPFAVLRTVSDPADHTLPPAALAGLSPEGGVDLAAVLLSLLRNPMQLPQLIRTARQSRIALDALREAAPVLARLFVG